ncbi:putative Ig domain-containing protein [Leptospira santarosai]|uniref:putative Ig domain-containing protein n=1 Tax=Leptospira santarosai TaxID=28183 RepID=UPI0002D7E4B8|nr:putative Ig domain-containing protein [Leptospira santarosai]MDI7218582.1 putative Ig domain-containing protein [Leptospira santarosai]
MKKIMLALLLLSLTFTSCEDEKKNEGSFTGNLFTDLLLLQGLSKPSNTTSNVPPSCPSGIVVSMPNTVNTQVGTPINPLGIQFSAGNTTHTTLVSNPRCNFSDFSVANLPAGLLFNIITGAVSGTPNLVSGGPVQVTFSAKLKSNNDTPITITKTVSMTVFAANSLTCNTVGAAVGCVDPAAPYSCPNSNFCYTTYSVCKAAINCGY